MAKVTSTLQLTLPKRIAEAYGIRPGTELEFESAGDVLRVRRIDRAPASSDEAAVRRRRLAAFDRGTKRQGERDAALREAHPELFAAAERGWRREDLYDRGVAR